MIMGPIRILAIGLLMGVVASLQISNDGCQCTSGLSITTSCFRLGLPSKCDVAPDSCEGKTEDCATPGWLDSLDTWLGDTSSWAGAKLTKIGDWTAENVQKIPLDDIRLGAGNLASSVWNRMSSVQIHEITKADLTTRLSAMAAGTADATSRIPDTVMRQFTAAQLSDLPSTIISRTTDLVANIDMAAIQNWSDKQVAAIPTEEMSKIVGVQLARIPVDQMAKFSQNQLKAINWTAIGDFTQAQWQSIPVDNLVKLSVEQLQQINYEAVGEFGQNVWQQMPVEDIIKLTGQQIQQINPDAVAGIAQRMWTAGSGPMHALVFFTATQVNRSGIIGDIDPYYVARMSSDVWAAIPVQTITQMTLTQLIAIDYTAFAQWSDEQWQAVPVSKLVQFVGLAIRDIPAANIATWTQEQWNNVPLDQLMMFTGDQINNPEVLAKIGTEKLQYLSSLINLESGIENVGDIITLLRESEVAQSLVYSKTNELEDLNIRSVTTEAAALKAAQAATLETDIETQRDIVITKNEAMVALGYTPPNEPARPAASRAQHATVPVVALAAVFAMLQLL